MSKFGNLKAEAQFDFAAQPNSNELNLVAGETLHVVRQDVGDGWWEGVNQRGERGLFPISYVKVCMDCFVIFCNVHFSYFIFCF